jgi:sugar phosphate isomerase/epimerase
MRFTICSEIFKEWPLPKAFAYAREAGYEAMEIAPFTLAPLVTAVNAERRREIRRMAGDAGIAISGIHWVLAYTEGMHVNHPDAAQRGKARDYLAAAVDFCADLGGTHLIFGSPQRRNIQPGDTFELAADRTLETFRLPTRVAEDRGVTICMEPLSPTETNFLNTAADTIALARRMESPAFKIMLDVKAMLSESTPLPDIVRASKGEFAYFHANDKNLKGPGFGEVDFKPIAEVLREVGYEGHVSVEVFNFDEGPEVIATKSRETLRAAFGE